MLSGWLEACDLPEQLGNQSTSTRLYPFFLLQNWISLSNFRFIWYRTEIIYIPLFNVIGNGCRL